MAHPIIKYRLTKAGRIPEYLCKDAGSFSGMYGVNTNKAGKIPKWTSPQETLYLGMACGDPDSDGLPDGLVVGQHATQPALVDIGHTTILGVLLDDFTNRTFRPHKQYFVSARGKVLYNC